VAREKFSQRRARPCCWHIPASAEAAGLRRPDRNTARRSRRHRVKRRLPNPRVAVWRERLATYGPQGDRSSPVADKCDGNRWNGVSAALYRSGLRAVAARVLAWKRARDGWHVPRPDCRLEVDAYASCLPALRPPERDTSRSAPAGHGRPSRPGLRRGHPVLRGGGLAGTFLHPFEDGGAVIHDGSCSQGRRASGGRR